MLGLSVVLILLSLLSIFVGLISGEKFLLVLGLAFFGLLIVVRLRFKVSFDENVLISTGFFTTKSLEWPKIKKVIRMWDYGYPKNRLYGPFVYEFQSSTENMKINFKLFSVECKSEIFEKWKALTR